MIDVHGVVFQHIFPEDEDFDSLLMYWPGNTTQENHILVLAKRSKQRSGRKSSVYLSQNYGKNWTKIDDKLTTKDGRPATIDHIYTSKMQAKLVSCFILSWIVLHIFCTTFYSWRLVFWCYQKKSMWIVQWEIRSSSEFIFRVEKLFQVVFRFTRSPICSELFMKVLPNCLDLTACSVERGSPNPNVQPHVQNWSNHGRCRSLYIRSEVIYTRVLCSVRRTR